MWFFLLVMLRVAAAVAVMPGEAAAAAMPGEAAVAAVLGEVAT